MAKEVKKTKVAKDSTKNSKDKRHFFKDFKAELKRVIWLTPKQLFNNTVAVLSIVLIVAVIVFVLDLSFEAINKHGINRLREYVETTTSATNDNTTNENNTNNENETVEDNSTVENEVQENTVQE